MRHAGYFRINVLRLNDSFLIIVMGNGFRCHTKSRTHLYRLCAKHSRCRKASAIRNTACRNHRDGYCIYYLWYKCKCRCETNVSPRLHSFRNYRICSGSFHQLRHRHTCHNRDYLHTGCFPHLHIFCRVTGTGGYHLHAFLCDNLRHFIRIRIHKHNIHTKRFVSQLLGLLNLLSNHFRRCTCRSDDSQSPGIRYCCRQVILRNPSHSPLNDWVFNSQ